MVNFKQVEIKTQSSFLNIYTFEDTNLLDNCIEECKDKLEDVGTRRVSFFSDVIEGNYMYGDVRICRSQRLTPSLKEILDFINERFNSDYNGIIVNYYKDGSHYIQKHSDSQNHPPNGVLLISYGGLRNFRIFDKITDIKVKDIPMIQGEMVHMGGDFQSEFTHDVEQDETITTERYSISFHKYMGLGLYE
jgi:alkylated DNA repair dioxygenase AlkB